MILRPVTDRLQGSDQVFDITLTGRLVCTIQPFCIRSKGEICWQLGKGGRIDSQSKAAVPVPPETSIANSQGRLSRLRLGVLGVCGRFSATVAVEVGGSTPLCWALSGSTDA